MILEMLSIIAVMPYFYRDIDPTTRHRTFSDSISITQPLKSGFFVLSVVILVAATADECARPYSDIK